MNDIAIMPPLASPSHPPHYRKAEVMVYGMTQAEEAEFRSCERVISRGAKDFYPVGRPWRAYKVRVSIAFNMLPLPSIVRIVGVSAAFEPLSSSVPVSAMNCSRASMGFLCPRTNRNSGL